MFAYLKTLLGNVRDFVANKIARVIRFTEGLLNAVSAKKAKGEKVGFVDYLKVTAGVALAAAGLATWLFSVYWITYGLAFALASVLVLVLPVVAAVVITVVAVYAFILVTALYLTEAVRVELLTQEAADTLEAVISGIKASFAPA